MNYMDSPNRAKYLGDVIHRMIASDQEDKKAQETPDKAEAPPVSTEAATLLQTILKRLEQLSEDTYGLPHRYLWIDETLEDIIRQGRGGFTESS